ncbi:MAG: hypothetical protein JSS02_27205 [Planctomycetes bacterium]|nr:hypothetical protein [Planctomycetota bacterium]
MSELLEFTLSSTHTVDREAGVIRGVKILGRWSRNRREYSDAALRDAARLYEGIGVNLNHADGPDSGGNRPVEAGFGWITGVALRPDGVFGDLHFFKSHPQAAVIIEAAERNPRRFGLSHNAQGRVALRQGKSVVESIQHVRSVDVVQNPATNAGLFESEEPLMSVTASRTIRQILSATHGPVLDRLLADDHLAPLVETEVVFEAEATPEQQTTAALKTLTASLLDDQSLELPARLDRLRDLLAERETAPSAGGTPATNTAGSLPAVDLRSLVERLDRLELLAGCRELLENHDRACDGTRLQLLAALPTADERVRLIESWPDRRGAALSVPERAARPTVSRPLVEAEPVALPQDARALAAALR